MKQQKGRRRHTKAFTAMLDVLSHSLLARKVRPFLSLLIQQLPVHQLLVLAVLLTSCCWAGSGRTGSDPVVEPLPLRPRVSSCLAPTGWAAPGLTFHVAPNGNDAGDGSSKKPFASLERARDEIRARREARTLPPGTVEVVVHGGEYEMHRTFTLSERDSGTDSAPVVFRAADGEQPVFRGGVQLKGWRPLEEADGYPQLPADVRTKVWIFDLRAAGITNVLPLKLGGFASGNGFGTHPAHELFFNGRAMQLARGSNDGFLRIKEVAVKDGTKGYDREGSKVGKFFLESDRLGR